MIYRCRIQRHVHDTDGNVGLALFVIGDHGAVVHLINMITGQDQDVRGVVRANELEILIHGVGGAPIPMRSNLLLSRNEFHEFAQLAA